MSSECRHISVTEHRGEIVVRFNTILMRCSSDAIVDEIGPEFDSLLGRKRGRESERRLLCCAFRMSGPCT